MYDGATVQFLEKFVLCWICNCLAAYPVTFSHPLFVTARLILVADCKQPGQMMEKRMESRMTWEGDFC
jgi:hypothetical protein